jgi:hypothetical protein
MKISLFVAVGLLLLHAAFAVFGPKPREPRFQDQEQQNRYIIERYLADAASTRVVYVGSSMAARLSARGGPSCAFNLSLHGESSLTGLSVATLAASRPKRVFVEINVPERKPNVKLIDKGNSALARHLRLFAVENMPVNLVFSYVYQLKGNTTPAFDATLLANGLAVQQDVYAHEIEPDLLAANMQILRDQVSALEASGTQVIFFELPIHPALEQTPRARQIRTAFIAVFPTERLITSVELSRGIKVRTIDGVHLSLEEADAVASALQTHHREACSAPSRTAAR